MTWLIVLASLGAYLAIARTVAPAIAARYAAWHEREFPILTSGIYGAPEQYRREAQRIGGIGGLFWPVLIVAWLAAAGVHWLGGAPPKFPSELAKERDEMAERIEQLERELGL